MTPIKLAPPYVNGSSPPGARNRFRLRFRNWWGPGVSPGSVDAGNATLWGTIKRDNRRYSLTRRLGLASSRFE